MPRRKLTAADFPPPGTILTFPLADGRFGACRVLRVAVPGSIGPLAALVALTEWIDHEPPPLDHPDLLTTLHLTHHQWANQPEIIWQHDPVPASFKTLGLITLHPKDADSDSNSFGAWEGLPLQRLVQWRWDHDRNTLLAEEALAKAEHQKQLAAKAERRARILAETTLPIIQQRKHLFPRWRGHVPAATIVALEKPIRDFLTALIAMPKLTRRDITRELRACVEAVNQIDTAHQHPIETIEREDIFDLFDQILTVAKHPNLIDKTDQWRDW